MCTLAFVPQPGGYLLGHNRDESVRRARGLAPSVQGEGGTRFLAPRDPDGGGTWIAVNERGVTVGVLNAAETDPSRLPQDPASRGLVVRDLASSASIEAAAARLDGMRPRLDRMRAFRLVVAAREGGPARAAWFAWDGRSLERGEASGPSLFVSSAFSRTEAEASRRSAWLRLLDETRTIDAGSLRLWLATHEPERGPLSVCMHREAARTVSRTIVAVGGGLAAVDYHDGPPCEAGAPSSRAVLPLL